MTAPLYIILVSAIVIVIFCFRTKEWWWLILIIEYALFLRVLYCNTIVSLSVSRITAQCGLPLL